MRDNVEASALRRPGAVAHAARRLLKPGPLLRAALTPGRIPNPAPHAAQVRWYSFQFLCQTLSDELLDMHERMAAVLAALPKPPRPQRAPRAGRAGVHEPLLPK